MTKEKKKKRDEAIAENLYIWNFVSLLKYFHHRDRLGERHPSDGDNDNAD